MTVLIMHFMLHPRYNSFHDASSLIHRSSPLISFSAKHSDPCPSSQIISVVAGLNTLAQEPNVTGSARRPKQTGQRRRWSAKTQITLQPKAPKNTRVKAVANAARSVS